MLSTPIIQGIYPLGAGRTVSRKIPDPILRRLHSSDLATTQTVAHGRLPNRKQIDSERNIIHSSLEQSSNRTIALVNYLVAIATDTGNVIEQRPVRGIRDLINIAYYNHDQLATNIESYGSITPLSDHDYSITQNHETKGAGTLIDDRYLLLVKKEANRLIEQAINNTGSIEDVILESEKVEGILIPNDNSPEQVKNDFKTGLRMTSLQLEFATRALEAAGWNWFKATSSYKDHPKILYLIRGLEKYLSHIASAAIQTANPEITECEMVREMNRFFRDTFGNESWVLFDTNFYTSRLMMQPKLDITNPLLLDMWHYDNRVKALAKNAICIFEESYNPSLSFQKNLSNAREIWDIKLKNITNTILSNKDIPEGEEVSAIGTSSACYKDAFMLMETHVIKIHEEMKKIERSIREELMSLYSKAELTEEERFQLEFIKSKIINPESLEANIIDFSEVKFDRKSIEIEALNKLYVLKLESAQTILKQHSDAKKELIDFLNTQFNQIEDLLHIAKKLKEPKYLLLGLSELASEIENGEFTGENLKIFTECILNYQNGYVSDFVEDVFGELITDEEARLHLKELAKNVERTALESIQVQTDALLYANESYVSCGAIVHVAGLMQQFKGNHESSISQHALLNYPQSFSQSAIENFADFQRGFIHYQTEPAKAIFIGSKYLGREMEAAREFVEKITEYPDLPAHILSYASSILSDVKELDSLVINLREIRRNPVSQRENMIIRALDNAFPELKNKPLEYKSEILLSKAERIKTQIEILDLLLFSGLRMITDTASIKNKDIFSVDNLNYLRQNSNRFVIDSGRPKIKTPFILN